MRRLILVLLVISILFSSSSAVLARDYMVNPFYAVDSGTEYGKVNGLFDEFSGHMYFQWARIARNAEGKMVFTNKHRVPESEFDKSTEYGFPGELNLVDYKQRCPNGKAFLSVFFEAINYTDGRNSAVDFLNMSEIAQKKYIIDPMLEMVDNLGFDGVVLDFEGFEDAYSNKLYKADKLKNMKSKYNKFISLLNKSLGDKKLIVCVQPTNVEGYKKGYDYKYINSTADYVILMGYQYFSSARYTKYDKVPASLIGKVKTLKKGLTIRTSQPYSLVNGAVKKIISENGIQANKLILGMELSAVKWIEIETKIKNKKYTYYIPGGNYEIESVERLKGSIKYLSDDMVNVKNLDNNGKIFNQTKDTYKKQGTVKNIYYYYESPKTLKNKYFTIANRYKIAGLSVWRLGLGSESVWKYLIKDFN